MITPPPDYSAAEIKAIRAAIGMSQAEFADALNVSASAVKQWERGVFPPEGGSLRLLEFAQTRPELFTALVRAGEP